MVKVHLDGDVSEAAAALEKLEGVARVERGDGNVTLYRAAPTACFRVW